MSYFPRWQRPGATGPYRVSPNLMVVVPTSHEVVLTYGATDAANEVGVAVTLAAIACSRSAGSSWWRRRRREGPASR